MMKRNQMKPGAYFRFNDLLYKVLGAPNGHCVFVLCSQPYPKDTPISCTMCNKDQPCLYPELQKICISSKGGAPDCFCFYLTNTSNCNNLKDCELVSKLEGLFGFNGR